MFLFELGWRWRSTCLVARRPQGTEPPALKWPLEQNVTCSPAPAGPWDSLIRSICEFWDAVLTRSEPERWYPLPGSQAGGRAQVMLGGGLGWEEVGDSPCLAAYSWGPWQVPELPSPHKYDGQHGWRGSVEGVWEHSWRMAGYLPLFSSAFSFFASLPLSPFSGPFSLFPLTIL